LPRAPSRPNSADLVGRQRASRSATLAALALLALACSGPSLPGAAPPAPGAAAAPGAPRSAPPPWIRGIVFDSRGQPVCGATITARPWTLPGPAWWRAAAGLGPSGDGAPAAAQASSGPAGLFLLLLPPGRWELELRAPGLAAQRIPDVRSPRGDLRVDLTPGYSISGTLTGFPAGSSLRAEPLEERDLRPELQAEAAPDGSFRVAGLSLGSYRVRASSPEGEQAGLESVAAGRDDLRIELAPRQRLRGVLLSAGAAEPVPHAEVTLAGSGIWPPRRALSDARGRFAFDAVPGGWYALRAQDPRGRSASGFIEGLSPADYGSDDELALVLEPAPLVELRLLRSEDGSPMAHAEGVLAPSLPAALAIRSVSDEAGRMRLGPLPPGRYELALRAAGRAAWQGPLEVPAAAAAAAGLELRLDPAAQLAGTAVDDEGRPVPNAECLAEAEGQGLLLGRRGDAGLRRQLRAWMRVPAGHGDDPSHRSDGAGRFRLGGLPPGQVSVLCQHPGHVPGRIGPLALAAGEVRGDLRVVLARAGVLEGQVVDSEGDPVAGARLRFGGQAGTSTDPAGRFVLFGVSGEGALVVEARGFSTLQRSLTVLPAAPHPPLLLTLAPGLAPLEGFVLAPNGAPQPNASLTLRGAGGLERAAHSDDAGRFLFEDLPPRPWTLSADAPGAAHWSSGVAPGPRPLSVQLTLGGSLRFEILEERSYDPLPSATLRLRGPQEVDWSGTLGNGFVAFDHLPTGTYRAEVRAPGHLDEARAGLRVSEGGQPDPERFLLAPGGELGGRVRDAEGRPLRGARIRATPQGGGTPREARSDARGGFRVGPLPEGYVELVVTAAGCEPERRMERVFVGEAFLDLDLQLLPSR